VKRLLGRCYIAKRCQVVGREGLNVFVFWSYIQYNNDDTIIFKSFTIFFYNKVFIILLQQMFIFFTFYFGLSGLAVSAVLKFYCSSMSVFHPDASS